MRENVFFLKDVSILISSKQLELLMNWPVWFCCRKSDKTEDKLPNDSPPLPSNITRHLISLVCFPTTYPTSNNNLTDSNGQKKMPSLLAVNVTSQIVAIFMSFVMWNYSPI